MSDKKKKGKKEGIKSLDPAEARTLEYYEIKVKDMNDKIDRLKSKCDTLGRENELLARAQTKFNHDKVGEHEKVISNLEVKARELEEDKREVEIRTANELDDIKTSMQTELEILQIQCTKYKGELAELSSFSSKKEEMELQIKQYRALLEKKEIEYRDTVHNLERKVLQDKNQMKREMLHKVNEAVANFRRVADQQMAETTKRAIRENMAISSQLKKMSSKTLELISDNDGLNAKVAKLKVENSLLTESEKQLAKRNQANQRVIKMLVEKLKESDQMLELAFESDQMGQTPGTAVVDNNQEFLTEDMKEEIQAMQNDYDLLVNRLNDVSLLATDLESLVVQMFGDGGDNGDTFSPSLDHIATSDLREDLFVVVDRFKSLTSFQVSAPTSENQGARTAEMESNPEIQSGISQSEEEIYQNDEEATNSEYHERGVGSGDDYVQEPDEEQPQEQELQEQQPYDSQYTIDSQADAQTNADSYDQEQAQESQESVNEIEYIDASQPNINVQSTPPRIKLNVPHLRPNMTHYQRRVESNFMAMISGIPSKYKALPTLSNKNESVREIGIQTQPLNFATPINSKFLLGEVRPWGPAAACLPKKGLGLYHSRASPLPPAESGLSSSEMFPSTLKKARV